LLAIVIASLSFAGLTLLLKLNTDISNFKLIVLTILTLDIAGGVVANFTAGTTNYYAESLRKRYFFVLFHLLQPSILIWIFPNEFQAILGVSIFTLLCSFIVLNINKHYIQRITAITLLLLSFILSILLNYSDPLLQIVMQLFSIKLILAFSVNWNSIDKNETRKENNE
jgi:membrane glycosyltransferase